MHKEAGEEDGCYGCVMAEVMVIIEAILTIRYWQRRWHRLEYSCISKANESAPFPGVSLDPGGGGAGARKKVSKNAVDCSM